MLNKKGFTVAEVIVSFSLISVILVSLISSTMFYRDKIKDEEVETQLLDYKNTILKTIYDDIVNNNIVRAEPCVGSGGGTGTGSGTCVNLYNTENQPKTLRLYEEDGGGNLKKGVYLSYDGTKYWLPDSDLGDGSERICDFVGGFEVQSYEDKIYKIKASFRHKDLNIHHDLLFIIN